jgi:hypothetical protein
METIQNQSNETKEQIYKVLAIACVTTAGLIFVAPFLVVAAGTVLALFG